MAKTATLVHQVKTDIPVAQAPLVLPGSPERTAIQEDLAQ